MKSTIERISPFVDKAPNRDRSQAVTFSQPRMQDADLPVRA